MPERLPLCTPFPFDFEFFVAVILLNVPDLPVITEGVDSATIRATYCIMSNCVTTVPALLFAYHDRSLSTP
ncbi:hypothetical protein ACSLPG_32295, partial [Escherichia coli]|uniref:hypothetical protein n=1 Tax=Escherichia coli TaxID=562 RepID=UPI003EE3B3E8